MQGRSGALEQPFFVVFWDKDPAWVLHQAENEAKCVCFMKLNGFPMISNDFQFKILKFSG